jgi:predicted anti-sigma-YlaC factor YlaD
MDSKVHERARRMIALSGPEGFSGTEQSWLRAHLESCGECGAFAERVGETIRSLRAIPVTAEGSLVSATRARVRERARALRRRQERLRVIWVCCAAVTLCTAFSTIVLWRGLAWMGEQAQLAAPVWEIGFLALCLMPALVTGILLLARGTYFADHEDSFQG